MIVGVRSFCGTMVLMLCVRIVFGLLLMPFTDERLIIGAKQPVMPRRRGRLAFLTERVYGPTLMRWICQAAARTPTRRPASTIKSSGGGPSTSRCPASTLFFIPLEYHAGSEVSGHQPLSLLASEPVAEAD